MFKLTPEARARVDAARAWQVEKEAQIGVLTNENLAATARFYMANMQPMRFAPGEPVYDATMWHVILPELLRRLK